MQIAGEWLLCDDGVTRPVVRAQAIGSGGRPTSEHFLIDTGADRTVFSTALLARLRFSTTPASPGFALVGISGSSPFVLVTTALELPRHDGGVARVRGEFAAFTDPLATDLSVLGRDVLDNFDLIYSRRRGEILLLASSHRYHVVQM